jgi:hypothetical protein
MDLWDIGTPVLYTLLIFSIVFSFVAFKRKSIKLLFVCALLSFTFAFFAWMSIGMFSMIIPIIQLVVVIMLYRGKRT